MLFISTKTQTRIQKTIAISVAIFFHISCVSHPPILYEQTGNIRFKKKISKLIHDSNLSVNMGIEIRSIATGETLYGMNNDQLLTPASNVKIFTTASALNTLGPNYQFLTQITENGKNICLRGTGDPNLSLMHLDSLAQLVSAKYQSIDSLFLDDTYFDDFHYGNGWMWDEGSWEYSAPVGALSLQGNCVEIIYKPGKINQPVPLNFNPTSIFYTVENSAITVEDTIDYQPFKIERDWVKQSNTFFISGELLRYSKPDTIKRNIVNPTFFTGTIFKEMLHDKGAQVQHIKKGQLLNGRILFDHRSDSLFYLTRQMMHDSDNLIAEILLKSLGNPKDESGSWKSGINTLKSFLANLPNENKIDTSKIRIADGSGLSRYNLASPSQFVNVLDAMYHHKYRNFYLHSFPLGGEKNSTLEERLINTGNKIRAKTGSLSGVSTLSGYAFSDKFGPLAFSIMMNGYVGSPKPYQDLQDKICEWLIK